MLPCSKFPPAKAETARFCQKPHGFAKKRAFSRKKRPIMTKIQTQMTAFRGRSSQQLFCPAAAPGVAPLALMKPKFGSFMVSWLLNQLLEFEEQDEFRNQEAGKGFAPFFAPSFLCV